MSLTIIVSISYCTSDQELAKVVIKKHEVELIVSEYYHVMEANLVSTQMNELDVSKQTAERTLREHKGDIIKALHCLIE